MPDGTARNRITATLPSPQIQHLLPPVSAINLTLVTGEHAFPFLSSSSHQTLSVTILKPTLLGHVVDRAQQGAQDVQITCSGGLGVQITCTGQEPGHRKDQPSGTG
jgi:hypothetical protein